VVEQLSEKRVGKRKMAGTAATLCRRGTSLVGSRENSTTKQKRRRERRRPRDKVRQWRMTRGGSGYVFGREGGRTKSRRGVLRSRGSRRQMKVKIERGQDGRTSTKEKKNGDNDIRRENTSIPWHKRNGRAQSWQRLNEEPGESPQKGSKV